MSNPDHLAQTLEKGCLLINMFLTLNHLRVQVDSSKPLHARIAQRFGVESRALCDALVQTPKQVFGLLTKVFEDCASIPVGTKRIGPSFARCLIKHSTR